MFYNLVLLKIENTLFIVHNFMYNLCVSFQPQIAGHSCPRSNLWFLNILPYEIMCVVVSNPKNMSLQLKVR